MRCPHCNQHVVEDDLLDKEPSRAEDLRGYDGVQYRFTQEEAVRRMLGHRLAIENTGFNLRADVYGRTIATGKSEDELWRNAFEYIVELGPQAYGVCLQ